MALVNVFSYASINVTTSTYVTLLNETPITVSHLQICDTSGQLLKIAVGLAGYEVDLFVTPVGSNMIIPIYLVAGQRLSIKAINATANSGYNVVTFFQNNFGS